MQAFMSSDRPGLVTLMHLLGLLVNVAGVLFLMPVLGMSSAVLAVLALSVVRLAFVLCCFPAVLKVRGLDLLPRRQPLGRFLPHWRPVR